MQEQRSTKRILTAATDNWFSRGYLALCAALLVWVAADSLFVEHADASFAGVWPLLATAPTSLLAMAVGPSSPPAFFVLVALAAYVNATLLGLLVRSVRHRTAHA